MAYHKQGISSVINTAIPARGNFSLSAEQMENLRNVSEVILALVATAGLVTVSTVAPNAFQAIHKLKRTYEFYKNLSPKQKNAKISKAFYYLKKSGVIKMKPTLNDFQIELTSKAQSKLAKIFSNLQAVPKPQRWAGTWWQIAADIPTKDHRRGADMLRKKLKNMQFFPLQRTLWFYPFDPRKLIQALTQEYNIENFVTVMEIKRLDVEDEYKLKNHFKSYGIL